MKILVFISQIHKPNGAERLAIELAEGLNKRDGIRADLMSMYSDRLEGVPSAVARLQSRGIERIDFLGLPINAGLPTLLRSVPRLRSFIKSQGYDVVESSLIGPSTLTSWATLGSPVKHLVGLHEVFRKARYTARRHRLWKFSIRSNRETRFYAISKKAVEDWLDFSGTSPQRTRLLYNSIHSSYFEARPDREKVLGEFGIPAGARIALFVGRLMKRKGVDTLLEGVGPLLEKRNLHLVYVGEEFAGEGFYPDEEGLVDRLKDRVAREGWSGWVHFAGRRCDVPRLMASTDLLVHPARIEGFGLVLAEAMAAGLPVIASNVDGIPEVLAESESRMIPPENPDILQQAVEEVLDLPEESRKGMIDRGRVAAERYRPNRRIDNMIQVFEDLLAGRF